MVRLRLRSGEVVPTVLPPESIEADVEFFQTKVMLDAWDVDVATLWEWPLFAQCGQRTGVYVKRPCKLRLYLTVGKFLPYRRAQTTADSEL